MKMMSNIESYQNLITLLKGTLNIYANKENYLIINDNESLIQKDFGNMANFALDKIKEFEDNLNIVDDYEEYYDDNDDISLIKVMNNLELND